MLSCYGHETAVNQYGGCEQTLWNVSQQLQKRSSRTKTRTVRSLTLTPVKKPPTTRRYTHHILANIWNLVSVESWMFFSFEFFNNSWRIKYTDLKYNTLAYTPTANVLNSDARLWDWAGFFAELTSRGRSYYDDNCTVWQLVFAWSWLGDIVCTF